MGTRARSTPARAAASPGPGGSSARPSGTSAVGMDRTYVRPPTEPGSLDRGRDTHRRTAGRHRARARGRSATRPRAASILQGMGDPRCQRLGDSSARVARRLRGTRLVAWQGGLTPRRPVGSDEAHLGHPGGDLRDPFGVADGRLLDRARRHVHREVCRVPSSPGNVTSWRARMSTCASPSVSASTYQRATPSAVTRSSGAGAFPRGAAPRVRRSR